MRILRILLLITLCSLACSAQTWSKWNGITVGSATGNISSMDGKTIGTSTGNYGKWNSLTSPASGPATWTGPVQSVGRSAGLAGNATYSDSLDVPTTANSVLVFAIYTNGTDNVTISSIALTGCTGSIGAWTGGTGTSYHANQSGSPGNMVWAYNITNGGGCTGFTVVVSAAPVAGWGANVDEWTRSTGSATLDALASTNTNSSSCTTCTGSSFTSLSGTSDLIVQIVNTGSGAGSPSSPYSWDADSFAAYVLNSTVTTAPTWTQSSGGFQTFGVAFK